MTDLARVPSPAAWDHPKVVALAKALSEAETFYDDRDWLVFAEVALVHLGLMEWVTETAPATPPSPQDPS